MKKGDVARSTASPRTSPGDRSRIPAGAAGAARYFGGKPLACDLELPLAAPGRPRSASAASSPRAACRRPRTDTSARRHSPSGCSVRPPRCRRRSRAGRRCTSRSRSRTRSRFEFFSPPRCTETDQSCAPDLRKPSMIFFGFLAALLVARLEVRARRSRGAGSGAAARSLFACDERFHQHRRRRPASGTILLTPFS